MSKKEQKNPNPGRRDFLKGMAAGASGMVAGSILPGKSSAKSSESAAISQSMIPVSWDKEAPIMQ